MTTKNQSQSKSYTPKQAQIKIESLLRGIDNNNAVIDSRQQQTKEAVKEIQKVLPAATAATAPAKAEKKPATAKANGKATATKPTAKANGKPASKPSEDNRPPLKQVITKVLTKAGKPISAAEIYRTACAGEHKWSRQSVYNALEKHFDRTGDDYKVRPAPAAASTRTASGEADEADRFVEAVENNQATSAVV